LIQERPGEAGNAGPFSNPHSKRPSQQPHTNMISSLIPLLIAGLVLYVIYYIVGMFIKGQPLQIIGIILGILFLVDALRAFHVAAI
jgi:hypothetical protein